jgi:hypothetical protein
MIEDIDIRPGSFAGDSADTRLLIQRWTGSAFKWRLIRDTARYAPWIFLVSDPQGQIFAPHREIAWIQCNRNDGTPRCRGPGALVRTTPVSVAEPEANNAMGRRPMKHDLVAQACEHWNQQPCKESGKRAPWSMATFCSSVLKNASYMMLARSVLLSFHWTSTNTNPARDSLPGPDSWVGGEMSGVLPLPTQ